MPVVSVGNLTVGGTGKTPFVEYLVRYFLQQQKKVAVVSRGYKRRTRGTVVVSDGNAMYGNAVTAGDEPVQIAKKFPRIVVIVDERRARGAKHAIGQFGVDVIILDDGFQHRSLKRDMDIIMIDGEKSLRTMPLLPAGMRREPLSALRRADVVAVTRRSNSGNGIHAISQFLSSPYIEAQFKPTRVCRFITGQSIPLSEIYGKTCAAFCGIGNPQSFYDSLKNIGVKVVDVLTFSDHHFYKTSDWEMIEKRFADKHADILITTEKDAVRLRSGKTSEMTNADALHYLEIEAEIVEGEAVLHTLIDSMMKRFA